MTSAILKGFQWLDAGLLRLTDATFERDPAR
jgi:hypothetical protein